uniref:hypothetical protein n=1 Tax=Parerythrobacter lutipelagi TaxID=1964208 RepID=UPI0010F96849|nr:hypothetical protein [Parerythrobacter lutipelagi]
MPAPPGPGYTIDHEVRDDGSVRFACSDDLASWPWLALDPRNPLVIQTQFFWASVGATRARQTRDDDKWSALTWTDWKCSSGPVGSASWGQFRDKGSDNQLSFEIDLFDAADRQIVAARGRGVVFRTRNFETWRDGAKREIKATGSAPADFVYADRALLNLSEREVPLIAPMTADRRTTALITKENGLPPAHPYFSGSGDHVNSTHLAEVARQVASLCRDGAPLRVTGGEMDMRRYIELGSPFEIALEEKRDDRVVMAVSQMGRDCSTLALTLGKL